MKKTTQRLTALIAASAVFSLSLHAYDSGERTNEPPRADTEQPAPPPPQQTPPPPPDAQAPTPPPAAPQADGPNIIEAAKDEGKFETLTKALETAGLIDVLQGEGPFTIFAPTDEAFESLPEGTLEELMEPENRQQLLQILAFHVVPGEVRGDDVEPGEVPTGLGLPAEVTVDGDEVRIDGARVVQTDISASNGVVHVIDRVMIPGS
ncbi:MAG: fasciclin domain-containing protein [Opitutales bacterium]|nr:fasciclin domain-containing protein [Opitutales bacterium]